MENRNNSSRQSKQRMFRFNFYWMYGIIFFLLIALYFTNDSSTSKEIGWTEFQKTYHRECFRQGYGIQHVG